MKRIQMIFMFILCMALLCSCGSAKPTDYPENLMKEKKVLTFWTDDIIHPDIRAQIGAFTGRVKQLSGGQLTIKFQENIVNFKAVQKGGADLALLRNVQIAQLDSLFSMFSMPFLYDDCNHMCAALNSQEILSELNARLFEQNLQILAVLCDGGSGLVTNREKVGNPTDFNSLVIAMRNDNAVKLQAFEAMGARVLPYTLSSVVPLMEQDIEVLPDDLTKPSDIVRVDTLEVSLSQVLQIRADQETLHFIRTNHTIAPLWVVISKDVWEQLDKKEVAILYESLAQLLAELESAQTKTEDAIFEQMKATGIRIMEIDRQIIAAYLYGSKNTSTNRLLLPNYYDARLYYKIQKFS